MSQANVEAFKRAIDAYNRHDDDAMLEELNPAIEWHMAVQEMLGGMAAVYHGHEGVREYLRDVDEVFDEFGVDYTEIRDLGDQVLAIGSFRVRGKRSGIVVESPLAALVDVDDHSKATRVLTYMDPAEALEAAGLSE